MATSAALSNSNLYSQTFWNIFNLINNRSNVADPVDATGSRKFVYAHEPESESRNFDGYPLIVINPASISRGERHTGDDKNAEINGELVVEVRSSDNYFRRKTATDNEGKGLSFLDSMSDAVLQTLNNVTNRGTLRGNNIGFVIVESRGVEYVPVKGDLIYVREFIVTTKTALLAVSS